ncbi:MAG: MarR family transcriptional regulator [Pseudomonadota bacterium]
MTEFKLDQFLPYQIVVLARRLSVGLAEIYSDKYGLTVSEWRVLAHLHDAGTCSVREIHLQADLEKSRVSRAVARLEARDLVVRAAHSGDKRLLVLALSPAGSKLVEEILPQALSFQAEVLGELEDAEGFQTAIRTLLNRDD